MGWSSNAHWYPSSPSTLQAPLGKLVERKTVERKLVDQLETAGALCDCAGVSARHVCSLCTLLSHRQSAKRRAGGKCAHGRDGRRTHAERTNSRRSGRQSESGKLRRVRERTR